MRKIISIEEKCSVDHFFYIAANWDWTEDQAEMQAFIQVITKEFVDYYSLLLYLLVFTWNPCTVFVPGTSKYSYSSRNASKKSHLSAEISRDTSRESRLSFPLSTVHCCKMLTLRPRSYVLVNTNPWFAKLLSKTQNCFFVKRHNQAKNWENLLLAQK